MKVEKEKKERSIQTHKPLNLRLVCSSAVLPPLPWVQNPRQFIFFPFNLFWRQFVLDLIIFIMEFFIWNRCWLIRSILYVNSFNFNNENLIANRILNTCFYHDSILFFNHWILSFDLSDESNFSWCLQNDYQLSRMIWRKNSAMN